MARKISMKQAINEALDQEMARIREQVGTDFDRRAFQRGREVFEEVALADDFADFLTLPAYDVVVGR